MQTPQDDPKDMIQTTLPQTLLSLLDNIKSSVTAHPAAIILPATGVEETTTNNFDIAIFMALIFIL